MLEVAFGELTAPEMFVLPSESVKRGASVGSGGSRDNSVIRVRKTQIKDVVVQKTQARVYVTGDSGFQQHIG